MSASTSTHSDFNINEAFNQRSTLRRAPAEVQIQKVEFIFRKRLKNIPFLKISKLSSHFLMLCEQHAFDPSFILGVIEVESGFRMEARSPKQAVGLMQIMLPTAQYVAQSLGVLPTGYESGIDERVSSQVLTEEVLLNPFVNLSIGVRYLAWLREHYRERLSPYYMLAAYNVGPNRMNQLLKRKSFTPVDTKRYFVAIQQAALGFREFLDPLHSKK